MQSSCPVVHSLWFLVATRWVRRSTPGGLSESPYAVALVDWQNRYLTAQEPVANRGQ